MPLDTSIKKVLVIGSGPIVIGQAAEFDYAGAQACRILKEAGVDVVLCNSNPATIMTDQAMADEIYLEPLTTETIKRIIKKEKPDSLLAGLGGQTGLTLAMQLDKEGFLEEQGVRLLGTDAKAISRAEDRELFKEAMAEIGQPVIASDIAETVDQALAVAEKIGYPVIVRPAFTLGGAGGGAAANEAELRVIAQTGLDASPITQILVERAIFGWKEIEFETMRDGVGNVIAVCSMENFDPVGVHTGDSIVVAPTQTLADKEFQMLRKASLDIITHLGIVGGCNVQLALNPDSFEYAVIEVNPRASRTVPYISKVTGVPMVDLATRVMVGQPLASLGYGTGLYRQPPYVAVKVPVFSFEKITDANAALSPEMKSTGEVLGLGKNMQEAMFKGLVSAGYKVEKETRGGVLISVNHRDQPEIVNIARKLDEMGYKLYATDGTAREISRLGTDVEIVGKLGKDNRVFQLLENGRIDYVILTGSTEPIYIRDFIHLNHRCVQLGIPCLTSLDTANALTDILASRYNQRNTELIDICHLRSERQKLKFSKLQTCGNDYIFLENFHGEITCPESLCVTFCDRHYGIGADGIVLMEHSDIADAKIRLFNADGSESATAGNALRCMGKYLYDNGLVKKEDMRIETGAGVREVHLYTANGLVTSACVDMGRASLDAAAFRFAIAEKTVVDYPVYIGGQSFNITCVDVGEPHCVAFCPRIDDVDVEFLGPRFEQAPYFPERINAEFIRVVNPSTIKMRVWERGSGEIMASGTGACAAVVAAVANGMCEKGRDVTVRAAGGDLVVNYTDEKITLTGDAKLVYTVEALY